ncbi:ABC transporter family substrate-binding protein [Gordonia polyisoprenivorans]|uniref:ABC transporter family substrate-binding protein n=1 Tax=Gordonia polyisoprenivorans TaxID=84595 RepID=UPI001B8CD4AD|nr:ABC transporter family substrate-binding protein [Gordonia polyisoprenivorans]QUD84364.1 ABC transporter family substrate-binding protein [Gordonia polyisoprenivorans]
MTHSAGRSLLLVLTVLAAVLGVAACTANPPPPVRDTATPQTPTEYPDGKTIYVATDSIGTGFNPHLGADQNPVTTAIAAMTLPSAFLPVQTPDGVVWQRNDALVTSAEVTSTAPFTVTYRIHTNAQWSDGLPVTGDDFNYLWQQMSRQPNVVAPAGYRLIDSVTSSAGSKVVEVRFAQPYPRWRELFTNLLPSHVLRGTPAGFQTGMDSGKPVSAGPFQIFSLDPTRDEVRLIRNDRYWMTPSKLDQVVLRRAGTDSQMIDSIRSGGSALATVGAGPATAAELTAVPGVTDQRGPTARALTVSVNARTPVMNRVEVRRAILSMIDTNLATLAGAGEWVVQQYANTVYAPSDPGYFPVNRPRPAPQAIDDLLAAAGYKRTPPAPEPPTSGTPSPSGSVGPSSSASPSSSSAPSSSTPTAAAPSVAPVPDGVIPYEKDGQDLTVRVGAISGDPRSTSAAANIVDQLRSAGVRAGVVSLPNSDLYGVALTDSRVDLVVGWTGLGVPPAAALASQVDCDQPKPGTAPSLSTPPTPTSVAPSQDASGATTVYASNISGVCDPALISLARDALSADDPTPMLAEAEPLLADQAIYLPLYQDSMLVGVTPAVTGVPLSGPIQTSIYGTAATWDIK